MKEIKKKYKLKIPVVDIIGKKWMCLQPAIDLLTSGEFGEYCRKVRKDEKCEFYSNVKGSELTVQAKKTVKDIEKISPVEVNEMIDYCSEEDLCPYEMSLLLAKNAKVDEVRRFDSGHSAFASKPKELANLLLEYG